MEKIFIKDLNCFGYQKDSALMCDNVEEFLTVWNLETLELLLEKQIETENYSVAELIKKEIQNRKSLK